jgi:hypothetical protein
MRALKVFFRRPQIMRNVEITINSVRMIYRDSTTVPTRPFELIASMASLGIQSCDASWTPAVLGEDDEGQLFRKLVTVSELSVSFECAGVREELLRPLTAELKMENYADGEPRKSGGRPAGVAQHTLRFSSASWRWYAVSPWLRSRIFARIWHMSSTVLLSDQAGQPLETGGSMLCVEPHMCPRLETR